MPSLTLFWVHSAVGSNYVGDPRPGGGGGSKSGPMGPHDALPGATPGARQTPTAGRQADVLCRCSVSHQAQPVAAQRLATKPHLTTTQMCGPCGGRPPGPRGHRSAGGAAGGVSPRATARPRNSPETPPQQHPDRPQLARRPDGLRARAGPPWARAGLSPGLTWGPWGPRAGAEALFACSFRAFLSPCPAIRPTVCILSADNNH